MARSRLSAAGGFAAILYVLRKSREAGGLIKLYTRLRSKNACKTCALGMGGQKGGMVNEAGHFPEVCKKSVQAQAADMTGTISADFFRQTPIAHLEQLTSRELESLGRLAFPVMAQPGDTHFRRITWKEAFYHAENAFQGILPQEVFFYSSGRSSNEAAFLMQLVARAYGTSNIHNCSYYCHQASGVALNMVYGSGTASVSLEDLEKTDLVLIAGANPASNHPRLMTQLMHLRRRGGKVIVVNPLKELGLVRFRIPSDVQSLLFGTQIADLYLQPHVGSDVALFKAVLKLLLETGSVDRDFVDMYTNGWEELEFDLRAVPMEDLIRRCGVPWEQIQEAMLMIRNAKRGILMWAMGVTHHINGVDNVLALSNIALARGWLGRPGSGLLPIRGHSNVQGVGSVGVTPQLKAAFAERLAQLYNIQVPKADGQDTYASMEAAKEGRIQAAFLLGGNLFASNPDRHWAKLALQNIPFTMAVTTKLNEGHIHGRGQTMILLPALARDEEPQPTTQESMFNYVRLSDGGEPAVEGEMRSEVEIIASLAQRILPDGVLDWKRFQSHHHLRKAMSAVVPGFEQMGRMDETAGEFEITGRVFHVPKFNTQDGRARFYVTPVPTFYPGPDEFRLMTLRSEGQFNTVVYEEEDIYRGNTRRDVVMMNKADAEWFGLAEGDRVEVTTEAGKMEASVAIVDIPPGNLAMYYPEANVLVPRRLDPRSKTPAFKSILARIVPLRKPDAPQTATTAISD